MWPGRRTLWIYNEKTFASQLEKNLRNKNHKIDLVNAAYAGFTWQNV